jgi:hypothetical protein
MFKDIIAALFSLIVLLLFGTVLYLVLTHPPTLSEGQAAIAQLLLGVLVTAFAGVMNYYIGSSASSTKKDETIQQAMLNAGTGNGETVKLTTTQPGTATATSTKPASLDTEKPTLVDKT